MKHIGIRDHNIALGADGLPGILGRVSVIGEGGDRPLRCAG